MACNGVKDVKVDFASRTATAVVDERKANPEKLVAAVKASDPSKYGKTSLKK